VIDSATTLRWGTLAAFFCLASCGRPSEPEPAPTEAERRGAIVFAKNCAQCHTVGEGGERAAPNLSNVVGRKAGATNFRYSPAFRRANFVWNRQTLDQYLTDPRGMVPDNQMAFFGMPDPAARADLIAYLARVSAAEAKR
jgi:cytochrome c